MGAAVVAAPHLPEAAAAQRRRSLLSILPRVFSSLERWHGPPSASLACRCLPLYLPGTRATTAPVPLLEEGPRLLPQRKGSRSLFGTAHCLGSPRGRARGVLSPPNPGTSSVAELCSSGWVRCCAVLACVAVLAPRSSLPAKLPRLAESRDATHPLAR